MGHVVPWLLLSPWLRALVTSSVGPGSPTLCRAGAGAGAALSCAQAWVAVGARPSSRRRWGPLLVCHCHTQPGTLPRREPVPGRGQYCYQSCDVVWTEAWGSQRLVTSPGARVPSPLTGLAYASCPSVPSTHIASPLALLSLLLFRLCALVSTQQLHLLRWLSGALPWPGTRLSGAVPPASASVPCVSWGQPRPRAGHQDAVPVAGLCWVWAPVLGSGVGQACGVHVPVRWPGAGCSAAVEQVCPAAAFLPISTFRSLVILLEVAGFGL